MPRAKQPSRPRLRIVRRPGSPWWWIAGTIAGQRIRESTRTDDQRAAEEYAATRAAELYRAGLHGAPRRQVTFAEAVVSYIEAGDHSAPTKARINRLLRHVGSRLSCEHVTQERLDEACRALLRPGAKPATRQREIVTPARAVLTHAARRGWCPPPTMERARVSPARTAWLTPAEADRLIASAAEHLRPLLAFLVGTGARTGEALALTWAEVDLAHARAVLRETKNGHDRIVELCPRVVAALAGLSHRDGAVFRGRSRGKDRVLPGQPYKAKKRQGGGQIKTAWRTAIEAASLPSITPHTLRHTWATWHYAMHRDLLRLRTDGGWRTATQVERYTKLAPEALASMMRAWRGEIDTKLAQTHGARRNKPMSPAA